MSKESWPKQPVRLAKSALVVRFASTAPESIESQAQRFRWLGLGEGRHFTVKMPEGGKMGYVSIFRWVLNAPPGCLNTLGENSGG